MFAKAIKRLFICLNFFFSAAFLEVTAGQDIMIPLTKSIFLSTTSAKCAYTTRDVTSFFLAVIYLATF